MRNSRLVGRLLEQALRLTKGSGAKTIHIRGGALSNISPTVIKRQFRAAAIGTALEGANLEFDVGHDPLASDALGVFVARVELID